jgi:DNA polymerase III psi subunit
MSGIPDIIDSKIVTQQVDEFWHKETPKKKNADAAVLVVSSVYSENDAAQLQKILLACSLNADQYNILQLKEGEQIAWHKLKQQFEPAVVLLFGIAPVQLGISALFQLYGVNNFDGCIWVPSASLQELEKQPEAKKQLWQQALKPLFADK